ncbi:fungal-specific transcription factor domain-containing protein [Mycena floridula]|nr:fungal-specific transcription factor domain-containing protein [Mycena floridula]
MSLSITEGISGDSGNMPGGVCSNCLAFGSKCTHLIGKRAQAKAISGKTPQDALQLDPLLLAKIQATQNVDGRPPLPNLEEYASTRSKAYAISAGAPPQSNRSSSQNNLQNTVVEFAQYIKVLEARLASKDTRAAVEQEPEMLDPWQDNTDAVLADYMNLMSMSSSRDRFYGKSSSVVLLKTASAMISKTGGGTRACISPKRAEMWQVHPWQIMQESRPLFLVFPDDDLMPSLINLYFTNCNLFRPLLHRPSFEKSLREGLHHRNYYFGATVLVVCALGSKYSDDRRVFLDVGAEQSCGWPFFSQVQPLQGISLSAPPSLYELQYYCLSVMFLHGTSVIETTWAILGIAIRLAQDVGLHRKMSGETEPTPDSESWKRVFWCVVSLDSMTSAYFGRPPALNSDDFDQEYPLECDDEHWVNDDPRKTFRQPSDKPSMISFFISYIKLAGVLEMSQRILYAVKTPITRKHAVAQLDEALDMWMNSVPEHLRWDPSRKDLVFFRQSACLYATYYYIKMIVHQPALICIKTNLAISVESARRCIDVLDHLSRKSPLTVPIVHVILFSSAAMLMINHWKNPAESKKDIDDVHRCLKLLKMQENRWQIAGKFCDTVNGLLCFVDPSAHLSGQISKRKRPQEESIDQVSSQASTNHLANHTSMSQLSNERSFGTLFETDFSFAHPASSTSSASNAILDTLATNFAPTNFTPSATNFTPANPAYSLPPGMTEDDIERLLLSTNLPGFEAVEHWGSFLDLPRPREWNL